MAGIDKSLTAYQGLLIPDDRVVWANYSAASSNTQAGPRPGAPEPDQDTSLAWEASGDSDGTTYDLRVQVGGCPGRDDGTWLWKESADLDSEWRGWDPPTAISGWWPVDSDTTADAYLYPQAIRLDSGVVLCASQYKGDKVRVWRLPVGGSWAATTVYTASATYSGGAHPCMVQLSTGRVLLFFLVESGTWSQLRMYYSDDDGATWTMGQRAALRHVLDRSTYDITRMRVARVGAEMMLVMSLVDSSLTCEDVLRQYASADGGASWALVDTWTGASYNWAGTQAEVIGVDDTFVVAYLRAEDDTTHATDAIACVRRVGSAWTPLSSVTAIEARGETTAPIWGVLSGGNFDSNTRIAGGLALCADDDGTLYLFGRDTGNNYDGLVVVSRDSGVTWLGIGSSDAPSGYAVWYQAGDDTGHPKRLAAVATAGRVLMFYAPEGSISNDDSLFVVQLGGYSTVEQPRAAATDRPLDRVTWGVVYWPADVPNMVGATWTAHNTGAPIADVVNGYLDITQAGGEEKYYSADPTCDIEDGIVIEADLHAASGQAYIKAVVSDGVNGHAVSVKVSSTQIVVRDTDAGTDLQTDSLVGQETTLVRIRMAIWNPTGSGGSDNGKLRVWARAGGLLADGDWREVAGYSLLKSAAHAAPRITFGGVLGAAHVMFGPVCYEAGATQTGLGMGDQDNPDDLQGRPIGAVPVEGPAGQFFKGLAGPGYRGDTWTAAPAYDHGVELAHWEVSRSPDERWRTVDNAGVEDINWTWTETEMAQGHALAIYLGGINFKTAELHGSNGAGVFSKICDISAAFATGLTWARYGNTVRPSAVSGANGGYVPENGCVGWTWHQTANAGANTVNRKVVSNIGGAWAPGSHRLPILHLEGAEATDDATGTSGELWSDQVLVIVQDPGQYKGFKLRLPAQETAEGYREVGVVLVGHLHMFGQTPSWGRELGWETSVEITTSRSGRRRVRAPAKVRRRVSFSWDEPVDTSELFASVASPSWAAGYSGGNGTSTPAESVLGMGALFGRLNGARTPVVYCPRIVRAASASADITITHPSLLLYGSIASTEFLATQSLGDECADPGEMLRGGRVTIEEEL